MWDTLTGELIVVYEGHRDKIWDLKYSTDGMSLATGSSDKTAKLWDTPIVKKEEQEEQEDRLKLSLSFGKKTPQTVASATLRRGRC